MIHVRIEIVPVGEEPKRYIADELFIANDGAGDHTIGSYDVYTSDPRGKPYPRNAREGWIGRIEGVERADGHRRRLVAAALELLEVS